LFSHFFGFFGEFPNRKVTTGFVFFLAQVGIAEFLVGVSSSQVTAPNLCESITLQPIRVASDRS